VPLSTRRRWTEDDLAKLKSMAGKYPSHRIAIELDRGLPAVVKAFEMRISLRQSVTRDSSAARAPRQYKKDEARN
jgi:hypothetical protein